jgi:O-antigen/teichoic acid export membrane protein
LATIASLRYEVAIPLPEKDEDAITLTVLSLIVVGAMSALTLVITFAFKRQIVDLIGAPLLEPYLSFLPVGLLAVGSYQALNYLTVRMQAFGLIARTKLLQGLGMTLTQVGFGFLKIGPLGLLFGQVFGQAGGLFSLVALQLKGKAGYLRSIGWRHLWSMAVRYKRFPQISSFSSLLNIGALYMPAIMLSAFYGPRVVGWFYLAQRCVSMPMMLIGGSVGSVYMGKAAKLAREDIRGALRLFLLTGRKLLFIGALPTVVLTLFAPMLIKTIFGNDWSEAGQYIRILAPMFLVQFVVTPLSTTIIILERQSYQAVWDISRTTLVCLSFILTSRMSGKADMAIAAYSLIMFLSYVVLFLLNLSVLKSAASAGYSEQS